MKSAELITRHLAVEIFSAVLRKGKSLEEEFAARMEAQDKKQPLENRDRTFVRLLVTTMLRRLGQIDNILVEKSRLLLFLPHKKKCLSHNSEV